MNVELADDFSKGSIYLVDPLTPLGKCSNCDNYFVAHYSATIEKFTCNKCGEFISIWAEGVDLFSNVQIYSCPYCGQKKSMSSS